MMNAHFNQYIIMYIILYVLLFINLLINPSLMYFYNATDFYCYKHYYSQL